MGQFVKTTWPLQAWGNCHFVHTTYFDPLMFPFCHKRTPSPSAFFTISFTWGFLSNANCCLATKYSPCRNPLDYYFFPSFTFQRERERKNKISLWFQVYKSQWCTCSSNDMHNPPSQLRREAVAEAPRVFRGRCMNYNSVNTQRKQLHLCLDAFCLYENIVNRRNEEFPNWDFNTALKIG